MKVMNLLHKVLSIVLPIGMTMGSLCLASCEETAEVDEYANWQSRNEAFIDSIATTAKANADGRWLRILSYKLDSIDINGNHVEHDTEDYIYCHVEAQGTGTEHPRHTDFVAVNYRGRLIPTANQPKGKVFDESYAGTFNPATCAPKYFYVDDLITGWSTALMHMVKGDTWRVYIPANLGYGSSNKTNIPAYSTLVFDINLQNFEYE